MTRPQQIFKKVVDAYSKAMEKEFGDCAAFLYWFHDDESVSVDGTLHEVLNMDTMAFQNLYENLDRALAKEGWFIENQNGTDHKFYRA